MAAPGNTRRLIRQTLTIARRDFIATVFTPTFLLFLLAPVIMGSFGAIGGLGASAVAGGGGDRARIVAVAAGDDAAALTAADTNLRKLFRRDEGPPSLKLVTPGADREGQIAALFADKGVDASAVLTGPLTAPRIYYQPVSVRHARWLAALAEEALRERRIGTARLSKPELVERKTSPRLSISGQHQSAFFTVFALFFLTLMLSGQAVGTMAEERGNKVIEVLAAAVPLESVFLGKLVGMFGVAVLFVLFWATVISQLGTAIPGVADAFASIGPAVGMPAFVILFAVYFTMAYMLLGATFLGVGAQASTMREIQMLSLPITIVQVAMFGLASAAASSPGSKLALVAELFPLSSPFAMGARGATSPQLWPHVAAILWQLLWVGIVITIGARAFRRGVLQSGGGRGGLKALFTRSTGTRSP
ncbi:ABC transporter permease [uncultured Sphingomonas sp.]|uniref:ABC transporter permease n=1 Tax=uncultured Sphingomonas sp. TaxID=158754 RepID=UPI0035C97267